MDYNICRDFFIYSYIYEIDMIYMICAHSLDAGICMHALQKSGEKLKYEDEEIENQYYPSIINGHSDPSN